MNRCSSTSTLIQREIQHNLIVKGHIVFWFGLVKGVIRVAFTLVKIVANILRPTCNATCEIEVARLVFTQVDIE